MKNSFQIAGGSIPGTDHTLPGSPGWKNNQDAYHIVSTDTMTLGIVSDGCGAGSSSEVGAKLSVRILSSIIEKLLPRYEEKFGTSYNGESSFFKRVREDFTAELRVLANKMGDSMTDIVTNYFSFTIIGFLVTKDWVHTFSIGDGFIQVNDERKKLGPFPNNEPPYIGLALREVVIPFTVDRYPIDTIDQILIASDGIDHLFDAIGEKNPNGLWTIEDPKIFLNTPLFFKKMDGIRGRLAIYNTEHVVNENGSVFLKKGLLKDDVTIVAVKRIHKP